MSDLATSGFMIALDLLMVAYTLWILALAGAGARLRLSLGAAALIWLGALHTILSRQALLPADLPGPAFLALVFAFVGALGAALWLSPVRKVVARAEGWHLLLPQGIRVFFGAGFLMMAATGQLPTTFGLLDGFTHVGAGFLGLLAAVNVAGAAASGKPCATRRARTLSWIANAFGLVDILVVASTLALVLLSELTPFHAMMYAVFLPAPIWLWLHVASIARLVRGGATPGSPVEVTA